MNIKKIDKILFVEDEAEIRDALSEVLSYYSNNLLVAENGQIGLELYKQHSPELVISDIKMPVMDGIAMSKKIKEIDKDAFIVFTTAFSDAEFFQEAISLQVAGYLLKPIDLDLLESKIESIYDHIQLKKDLALKERMLIQQAKLAAMGEMIGNIAHQWRQPLTAISASASSIKFKVDHKQEIKDEFLLTNSSMIIEQSKYLSDTIDDFRTFFRSSNKKMAYSVGEFLHKCTDLVKASFDSSYITVIKEVDDKINSYGNPNQLEQAVINILNNAKDALKSAEGLKKKLVFVLTAKEDTENNIIITIKDNAGGIDDEIIDRIFEPYFTTKHQSVGTGLGLYITHTIVTKNLKGEIYVSNEEFDVDGDRYKGAKFVIKLPMI
jgi:signal transduction histidine kinase